MENEVLTPHQQKIIDEAPSSCRGIILRAYRGKSKATAIKAFCLACVGYSRKDVTDCTAYGCALHQYRPYQAADEPDDDEPQTEELAGKP